MSDTTPTNPADDELRKQIALAIAGDTPDAKHFLDDADAALTVVAPVLEGLRAELDAAYEQRNAANRRADENFARTQQAKRGGAAVQSAVVADLRQRAERYRDRANTGRIENDGAHAFAAQVLDHLAMGYEIALPEPTPSVSDQTPATPPHAFSQCNWWMDTRQCTEDAVHDGLCARHLQESHDPATAPSSVQGDTTPKEACVHGQAADGLEAEPATVSLCGVPHRISCNLVTEADEQWCTCDGPQRVGEALLARLNGLSPVQDSESSCSCGHAPERHGSNAGGCIECPCRAASKDEGHRNA